MQSELKRRQHRTTQNVKQRIGSTDIQLVVELLDCLIEEAKNNMLSCELEQMMRHRSEANSFDRLRTLLTEPMMEIQRPFNLTPTGAKI
jgi:hypothetical protein